jgi:hypothetical protein
MSSWLGWAWLIIGVLGVVDAYAHSSCEWTAADRTRPFWAVFMLFFGPIFVPLYAIVVRPRFARARTISDEFRA